MVNKKLVTQIVVYVLFVGGGAMLLLYMFLLAHIYNGNQNKWLFWIVGLLMLSNIGRCFVAYSY